MSELDQSSLEEALCLLGEYLSYQGGLPIHLLVAGGSALLASGVISRSTSDLDVMAQRGLVDGEIIDARPLPASLVTAAAKVATEMKLPENWINADFALLALPFDDYPRDFLTDLMDRSYGTHLSISYLGRSGLIYLKFHAATDPQRKRRATDLADLQNLQPTAKEIQKTLHWMECQGLITSGNHTYVEEALRTLGHEKFIPNT